MASDEQTDFVNEAITCDDNEEGDGPVKTVNTMQDTIKEMGEIVHKKYPKSASNLTHTNTIGQTRIDVLIEYNLKNFGYDFTPLRILSKSRETRVLSVGGFGLNKMIDFVKSIQMSVEQQQIPDGLRGLLKR